MPKREPNIGKCKLCGKTGTLIKAHIYPKKLFETVFDEKHKIMYTDFVNPYNTVKQADTGFDYNLFCQHCDNNVIGKYESYFYEKIMGKRGAHARKEIACNFLVGNGDIEVFQVTGLDYNKLKLFALSILLRASLTTNPFFKYVDVSNHHDELIHMVSTGIACSENKFIVKMMFAEGDSLAPFHMVPSPREQIENGNLSYIFYIAQYVIFINISDFNISPFLSNAYLKKDGTMDFTIIKGEPARTFVKSLIGQGVNYNGPFRISPRNKNPLL